VVDDEAVEDVALALLGQRQMLDRVVRRRCIRRARQQRRLRPVEIVGAETEVAARGGDLAPN